MTAFPLTADTASDDHYPAAAKAWWIVAILFLTTVLSGIDKYILNVVIDPIRQDLGISEVQVGLLQGVAVGVMAVCFTLVVGFLVDRRSRRRILMAGIAVWSLATVFSGLATDFWSLALSRAVVGLGGAVVLPAALSIISDLFPAQRRAMPLGVYLAGASVGQGLAVILGGLIIAGAGHVPAMAQLAPWRTVFIACGLLGLAILGLYMTFGEPRRNGLIAGAPKVGIRETWAFFSRRAMLFAPFYMALTTVNSALAGINAWEVVFLMRKFEVTLAGIGGSFGLTMFFVGIAGYLASGVYVQKVASRTSLTGNLKLLTIIPLLILPSAFAALAPTLGLSIALLAVSAFMGPAVYVTVNCALQELTPNNMRGMSIALASLANVLFGITFGPLFVAAVTEHVFKDPVRVGDSMMVCATPALIAGSLLYVAALNGCRVLQRKRADKSREGEAMASAGPTPELA